jgi:hypothetical protein
MAQSPLRRRADSGHETAKPRIWATGEQRPPFDIRAFGRVSLYFARLGMAPLHAWVARTSRRVAVNVKNGAGRIPEAKLGRAARYFPSHLRVAAWIKNFGVTFAHASASADPDIKRGNAFVAEIEPHLWQNSTPPVASAPQDLDFEPEPEPDPKPDPEPVVLAEPMQLDDDPLASIRDDLEDRTPAQRRAFAREQSHGGPAGPPAPPGPIATVAIQMIGYGIGWGTSFAAFPYGMVRALWLYVGKSQDLRTIGTDE